MMDMKISKFFSTELHSSLLFILLLFSLQANSQVYTNEKSVKPTQYIPIESEKQQQIFFQGFTLSADLFNPCLYLLSDYGNIESALRLNLKNTYFPIVEAGYGICDAIDDNTDIHYETKAPFIRIGCDMNVLRNKIQDNRLYVGVRYGISNYKFDISGPSMIDPIWNGSSSFNYKGLSTTSQWGEIVIGVQVKIWQNIHMGWNLRMKREFSSTKHKYARPYYIPGYGTTTNSTVWGGNYNLIFDLNCGKKKQTVNSIVITKL
jgi:hypothetical protein